MLLTEYNEAEQMELFREDGIREGIKKGLKEGKIGTLVSLVKQGLLSIEDASKEAGITEEEFERELQAKSDEQV